MTEQTILLLCLFGALAATLGLYFLKEIGRAHV